MLGNNDEEEFTGERLVINSFVKDHYNSVLQEHLERYKYACQFVEGKIVLDAACGTGYGTNMIGCSGADYVVGVDLSDSSVVNANKLYGVDNNDYLTCNVNLLPFKTASIDVVVSFETIEHIPNGERWIDESSRVLKDDGLLIISTPNRYMMNPGAYFADKPKNPHHVYEYSFPEFVGRILKRYDIIELSGQLFFDDFQYSESSKTRKIKRMLKQIRFINNINNVKNNLKRKQNIAGIDCSLRPFGDTYNQQPLFVIALCKKKTRDYRRK